MNKAIPFLVLIVATGGPVLCQQTVTLPTVNCVTKWVSDASVFKSHPEYVCSHGETRVPITAPSQGGVAELSIESPNSPDFANRENAASARNASIRGAMANSAIHSWSAMPALSPPSDSIAAAASLTDPFATGATCSLTVGSSQTIAADDKVVEYLQQAADSLKSVKSVSDLAEPAALGLAALNATSSAAAGVIPTTLSSIRKLADYLNGERSSLSALSTKSGSDWLAASGINSFDRSTIPAAQTCLDNFSQRLSTLQGVVQQLTPLVQTVQALLENSEVNSARMVAAGNTLPTGDSMAIWSDIIPALGNISTQIDTIQSNLSLARSSTY